MAGAICTKTLYSYIEQGVLAGITHESLWEKRKRRRRSQRRVRPVAKRLSRGPSIDQRPLAAQMRSEFGHWEMDLVVGPARGSAAALLTLVERKHRHPLVYKLPNKRQTSVLAVLRKIEREYGTRKFRKIFKTITVDNGGEFLDFEALQSSAFSRKQRTAIFYAHPFSAWERGSNENAHRILRRFIVKGREIKTLTQKRIKPIQNWINQYPRRILNFQTPHDLFQQELKAIA